MGTIVRRGDAWRAQIFRKGIRESRTFATRQEAVDWVAEREDEILTGRVTAASKFSFADLCDRYERAVVAHRRNPKSERTRLAVLRRSTLGAMSVPDITPAVLAEWRDARLAKATPTGGVRAPSSVLREMTTIRSLLEYARRDLGWIEKNPIADVRKPQAPPPRTRTISDEERDAIVAQAGYAGRVETVSHEAAVALLLALETAMRAGEIVGLRWADVDLDRRVAHLPMTKNGRARDVPLIGRSVELLTAMREKRLIRLRNRPDKARVFHVDEGALCTLFRRLRSDAGLQGFTFHDSRATALTRLARLVDVMTLAKISGHRDVNLLLGTYYRESAAQIAARLD